jgi:hypothetical protein
MDYLFRTKTPRPRRSRKLATPRLNLDIRKRGFDPFFTGIAVGAIATLIGLMLGWFVLSI